MTDTQKEFIGSVNEYLDDWYVDNPDQKTHMTVLKAFLKAMEIQSIKEG